jgi:hypothetical protein
MKNRFMLVLLGTCLVHILSAEPVWNEPLKLITYDNITYRGNGFKTSDDCVLLSWYDSKGETQKNYLQKFSAQMTPQWSTPVELPFVYDYVSNIVETSDASYMMLYTNNSNLYGLKISNNGTHLWTLPGNIILDSDIIWSDWYMKMIPDNLGGAYIVWDSGSYTDVFCGLQHINSEGTVTYPDSCLTIDTTDASEPDIVLLPDNGVIVSYSQDEQVAIKRISPTGQLLWQIVNNNPESQYMYVNKPKLFLDNNNQLTLMVQYVQQILAYKYNIDGASVWQNPVVIEAETTNSVWYAYYAQSGQYLYISWVTNVDIRVQRMSYDGSLSWQPAGILIQPQNQEFDGLYLVPDNNNGCFLVINCASSYPEPYNYWKAQHVTSTGSLWAAPVPIFQTSYSDYFIPYLYATLITNQLFVSWYEVREEKCGIYGQAISETGNLQFPQEGAQIKVGSFGRAMAAVLTCLPGKAFTFWLKFAPETSNYSNGLTQVYYQVVNSNGTTVLPFGGLSLVNGDYKELSNLKTLNTDDNQVLVYWIENDAGYRIKAQLLDANGNRLWDVNGKIICQSAFEIQECTANYSNGDLYFLWTMADADAYFRIYGQKFTGGIAQWALPYLQIVGTNPSLPTDDYRGIKMYDNIICWESYHYVYAPFYDSGTVFYLMIDSNGLVLPEYNSYGNVVAQYPPEFVYQKLTNLLRLPDGLLFVLANVRVTQNGNSYTFTSHYYVQKINYSGVQQLGINGIEWDYSGSVVASDEHLFSFSYSPFTINKINFDLSLESTQTASFANGYSTVKAYPFSDNCFLVTAFQHTDYTTGTKNITHFFFDENAAYTIPENDIVAIARARVWNYNVAIADENAYISWANNDVDDNSTYPIYTKLYIQRVNNSTSSAEDYLAIASPVIDNLNNYPNPFNDKSTISFKLNLATDLDINIYNTKGQLVKTLFNGKLVKGEHQYQWDGKDFAGKAAANGVYLYRIKSSSGNHSRKLILLK